MKKNLLFAIVGFVFCIGMYSCSDDYDDTAIWNEINNLKTQIEKLNSDLSKLQTTVTKMESGKHVTDYTKTENGCTLTFNDGTTVTIENGKAGVNAPIIGIKESNGIYYWTLTTDGVESWLTYPGTSDRIPVSGADGETPKMGVDADGYWTVNGVRLLDANNQPVKAGADSQVSIFSDSQVSEDGTMVILTLTNGSTIKIPLQGGLSISISEVQADFGYAEAKPFTLRLVGVEKITFTKPDGWKVSIDGTLMTVTAPAKENTYADMEGTIALIGIAGNNSCMAELKVATGEPVLSYSVDGNDWNNNEPTGQFTTLAVKTLFGGTVTASNLDAWDNLIPDGNTYSLDLSEADYESTIFKSYGDYSPHGKLSAIVLP
ncbi:MAG: PL29 family lyase N-terminal domain-containing protein, partial [Phocaeicola sp.]